MEPFSALLAFLRGIHRSPVNSQHKGRWRGALIFSLICDRINGWVNNGEAGDFRRHRAHCDVIVMSLWKDRIEKSRADEKLVIRSLFHSDRIVSGIRPRALAMELLQSCTKPSTCHQAFPLFGVRVRVWNYIFIFKQHFIETRKRIYCHIMSCQMLWMWTMCCWWGVSSDVVLQCVIWRNAVYGIDNLITVIINSLAPGKFEWNFLDM